MNKHFLPPVMATRRYIIEFAAAIVSYCVILVISLTLVRTMQPGWWRVAIALTPVIPVACMLVVFVRAYSRQDEMWRRISLEATALSAGTTVLWVVTCAFLENVGLPRLSGFWTFDSLIGFCAIYSLILRRRYQ